MPTSLITGKIWPRITKTAKDAKTPCCVAVAYFGSNGSQLLPLRRGSRLVVDASDNAVKAGQTNPTELLVLMRRGVAVFSVPNLHAKVFVLGRKAFIGSTNASVPSADNRLVEAVLLTTETGAVAAARQFVKDLCLDQLTPKLVQALKEVYRPPQIPGGGKGRRKLKKPGIARPHLPPLRIAKLRLVNWSESAQKIHDKAIKTASKRRQHRHNYRLDSFLWSRSCHYAYRDKVIQVIDEGNNGTFVSPPGNVLYIHPYKTRRGGATFVYVERPDARRRRLQAVTKQIGKESSKILKRGGTIRNPTVVQKLLGIWS